MSELLEVAKALEVNQVIGLSELLLQTSKHASVSDGVLLFQIVRNTLDLVESLRQLRLFHV